MLITVDNFSSRGFSKETIEFFAEKYPLGAEFKDLCEDNEFDLDAIHLIWNEICYNDEDLEYYKKRANIENTSSFYRSSDIKNSKNISESKRVDSSEFITFGSDIMASKKVIDSYNITSGEDITFSSNIFASKNISNSSDITESENVANSNNIVQSHSIYRSKNIKGSHIVSYSHDLNSCIFSSRCSKSNGLLFCHNIENANLMLFNKPIKFSQYSKIQREFCERFRELSTYILSPIVITKGAISGHREIYDIREHYKSLTEEFWEWVKTLPNYNSQIMYDITYISSFLAEKE